MHQIGDISENFKGLEIKCVLTKLKKGKCWDKFCFPKLIFNFKLIL